jgi:hypothetical protein
LNFAELGAVDVNVIVWLARLTVRLAVPLDVAKLLSPAKLALTPVAYVPTLIPLRLAPASVATPEASVVAEPTGMPFKLKLIDLPLTGVLSEVRVSVALRLTVPPYVPVAGLAVKVLS